MTTVLPGYARPNTTPVTPFPIDIGRRNNPVIEWRPVGDYQEAAFDWTFGLEPGTGAFTLHPEHPLVSKITNVKRRCFHVRTMYNGKPWNGRIMRRRLAGTPGREKVLYTCVDNKYLMQRWLAWVNPGMPPWIQVGLTGKQDVMVGPPDPTFKYFFAKNMTRLNFPAFCKLPLQWPAEWTMPDIGDIDSLDDLLDLIADVTDPIVALQARFPRGADLFEPSIKRLEMGISVDLWDGHGTSPKVFNTSTLGALQSIIDASSDHFLDLSQLLKPINNGLWSDTLDRAGMVFDTKQKRDNRKVQFRTDAPGQIESYEYEEAHPEAGKVIVGGKSPAILNDVIEIGANLAIQLLLNLIAPGLGLGAVVGDLFDDIFFAYQQFWDQDLIDDVGEDDIWPEDFVDNTAAHSLDSYATGMTGLKERGGGEKLTINATSGGADGRGMSFGADNGTSRRFDVGDIIQFWDRGNTVEQYVSKVAVADKRNGRMLEQTTVGESERLKGPWDRTITGLIGLGATSRAFANSV